MEFSYAEYAPVFKALSDETRIKIVHMLSQKELCACDILEDVNISQSTLSYHMKLLAECGLVNSRKVGSWMHYSIEKQRILSIEHLLKEFTSSTPQPIDAKVTSEKTNCNC